MFTQTGEDLYAAVMSHVYPLMKERFASIEHLSFFVELTNVSLETSRPEFQNVFTFLCLDEKVSPRFALCLLLRFRCLYFNGSVILDLP